MKTYVVDSLWVYIVNHFAKMKRKKDTYSLKWKINIYIKTMVYIYMYLEI